MSSMQPDYINDEEWDIQLRELLAGIIEPPWNPELDQLLTEFRAIRKRFEEALIGDAPNSSQRLNDGVGHESQPRKALREYRSSIKKLMESFTK